MLHTRALAAFTLATLALVAGCVTPVDTAQTAGLDLGAPLVSPTGVAHTAGGLVADLLVEDLVPVTGGQFFHGHRAPEPTIGVTSDGTVYMTGMASAQTARGGPTIYASADKGQTWKDVGPKVPATGDPLPPNTNDPYVHVDTTTDRVFMLDLHALVCSTLSWTDNGGASWTTNPLGCGHPVGVHDHQTMVTAKNRGMLPTVGYDNVVYYCVNRVADTSCATSLNGGLSFGPLVTVYKGADPAAVPSGDGFCGGLSGHLEAAPDGTVYLARTYCGEAKVAVTKDSGLTWDVHDIAPVKGPSDHDVDLAVDEAGNVYAFWMSEGLVWLSHSTDQGASWSEAKMVAAPGVTATMFNAIAAGKEGHIAFAYIGTTIEDGYENKTQGNGGLLGNIIGQPDTDDWDAAVWNAYIGVSTNALAEDFVIQSLTANPVDDPIARGLCGGTRCNGMTDFIGIQIDAEGRPWASFVDVCTEECVTDKDVHNDEAVGFAATLLEGPALRGETTTLAQILPQAVRP